MRKLAEGLADGNEGCRAAPGTMSVAEHILHVLSAEKTAIDAMTVTPGKWEWRTGIDVERYPGRAGLLAAIEEQTSAATAYFAGLTAAKLAETVKLPWGSEPSVEVFWVQWFGHDAHHCGSAVSCLRACGVQPPNVW
jgi:uncharacterized damage-inducible protein DinB